MNLKLRVCTLSFDRFAYQICNPTETCPTALVEKDLKGIYGHRLKLLSHIRGHPDLKGCACMSFPRNVKEA